MMPCNRPENRLLPQDDTASGKLENAEGYDISLVPASCSLIILRQGIYLRQ